MIISKVSLRVGFQLEMCVCSTSKDLLEYLMRISTSCPVFRFSLLQRHMNCYVPNVYCDCITGRSPTVPLSHYHGLTTTRQINKVKYFDRIYNSLRCQQLRYWSIQNPIIKQYICTVDCVLGPSFQSLNTICVLLPLCLLCAVCFRLVQYVYRCVFW